MTVLDKLESIIKNLEFIRRDAEKADRGNLSAGVRVRKDVLAIRNELNELRQTVLNVRREKDDG